MTAMTMRINIGWDELKEMSYHELKTIYGTLLSFSKKKATEIK